MLRINALSLPIAKARGFPRVLVIRGIAGTLGVTLSSTFLEHQRTTHAIYLAQQQGELELPAQWIMAGLQQTFAGLGDAASEARVKAEAHRHGLLLEEATVVAYQDVFMLLACISFCNVLPALLRKRARHARARRPKSVSAPTAAPALKAHKEA